MIIKNTINDGRIDEQLKVALTIAAHEVRLTHHVYNADVKR